MGNISLHYRAYCSDDDPEAVGRARGQLDVFRTLVEHPGLRVAGLDPEYRIVDASDGFARIFDRTRDSVRYASFLDLLDEDSRVTTPELLDQLFQCNRHELTLRVASPAGGCEAGDIELTAVAVRDDAADAALVIVSVSRSEVGQPAPSTRNDEPALSELDARIIEGIALGEPTTRIASRLYLSPQAIEYHVGGMLRKFDVPSRAALVSRAFCAGVLDATSWPPKVLPEHVK
jgi:DNA-binding CsgD family transcriptional regulator